MDAFIVDAVRTVRGNGKPRVGALASVHPQELLAQALAALVQRTSIDPGDIDDVIAGCVTQAGEQGGNIARQAVLSADWPFGVTATSVNMACGSSSRALHYAVATVACGTAHAVVAGGVESMSRAPMGSDGAGMDGNNARLRRTVFQVPQGISADLIATLEGVDRDALDRFALQSQQRATVALQEHRFTSAVPVHEPGSGAVLLDHDELLRPDATIDALSRLTPAFEALGRVRVYGDRTYDDLAVARCPQARRIRHVHTAGNSSTLADGAAVALVCSGEFVRTHGLRPRARVRAVASAGADPVVMLTASGPAARKALQQARMDVDDVDLWDINEAFAVVTMKVTRDLRLDSERVNVNGGAIALGHPLGATGAMLISQMLDELERRQVGVGLVALCTGGGQGVATILERP